VFARVATGDAVLLGHLLVVARKVADQLGLIPDGFRLVINDGPNGGTMPKERSGMRLRLCIFINSYSRQFRIHCKKNPENSAFF